MSNSFTIKTRTDGSYARDENNRVLVTGTDTGELAWLDHTQLDSIAKAKAAKAGQAKVDSAVEAQIAVDPVITAMKEAQTELAQVSAVSQIPDEFITETIAAGVDTVQGNPGHSVQLNHDSQVIRLIEAGRFDNLVWDVTYTGSRKIAVLF